MGRVLNVENTITLMYKGWNNLKINTKSQKENMLVQAAICKSNTLFKNSKKHI